MLEQNGVRIRLKASVQVVQEKKNRNSSDKEEALKKAFCAYVSTREQIHSFFSALTYYLLLCMPF